MSDLLLWSDREAVEALASRFITNTQQSARSDNTSAAYESDWRQWVAWLARTGTPMPDSHAAVVVALGRYLEDTRDILTASTLRRRVAGIRSGLLDRGLPWPEFPARRDPFQQYVDQVAREQARGRTASPAVTEGLLRQMVECTTDDPSGHRDRAVVLVGFLGALRRSEISRLDLADLDFRPEGVIVHIRRSKTDQTARGRRVSIPLRRHPRTCAVRALEDWIGDRGSAPGPLFTSLRKGRPNRPDVLDGDGSYCYRMDAAVVNQIVQRLANAAGDARPYTAHSLRSGFVTETKKRGADSHDIKLQTGHRSLDSVEGYTQDEGGFGPNNPVHLLTGL